MPSVFISLILAWAKADSAKVSTSSELPMILMELITASENKFYLAKWFLQLNTEKIKYFKNVKIIISENYNQVLIRFKN